MSAELDWNAKFRAMQALVGDLSVALHMRRSGDWYVMVAGVEIKKGTFLSSTCSSGATPEAAVNDEWRQLTELAPGEYLVLNAYGDKRRAVKWNGFMWAPYAELVAQ